MIDPPRPEVKDSVAKCKTAGIKAVMITGDHKITAIAIAKQLGIIENENEAITGQDLENMSQEELEKNITKYAVYARVSPEHKVRIVKAWQKHGDIVAMTGDGVNDAPALKTANIGCAMGITGTDVSKEAADVILTDDNFASVVSAVEEGRRIYDNILKAIQFLLSSNVGELIVLFLAIVFTPLIAKWFGIINIYELEPLLPIHILWINLVTDSLPALALAVDPAVHGIMERKPLRSGKGIFTKGMTYRVIYQGVMVGLITLIAFLVGLNSSNTTVNKMIAEDMTAAQIEQVIKDIPDLTVEEAIANPPSELVDHVKINIGQTMAFFVLALSELVHVYNIRNNKESVFKTGILNNSKLILATIVSAALMLVIVFVPQLRNIFSIAALPRENIIEVIVLVFSPLIIVEMVKLFKANTTKDEA